MNYTELAPKDAVERVAKALKSRGIHVEFAENKDMALKILVGLIPKGSAVMTGGSTTLDQIGFTDALKSGRHGWNNLKGEMLAEKDPAKQAILRKGSVTAQYFIGSVHAVTKSGEVLVASGSGSQIPSYAFSSDNVIWVVGTQKIVPDMENGLRRLREHALPLEDRRMKNIGYQGSTIGKILIFEREIVPSRKVTLIFVNEMLGF